MTAVLHEAFLNRPKLLDPMAESSNSLSDKSDVKENCDENPDARRQGFDFTVEDSVSVADKPGLKVEEASSVDPLPAQVQDATKSADSGPIQVIQTEDASGGSPGAQTPKEAILRLTPSDRNFGQHFERLGILTLAKLTPLPNDIEREEDIIAA